MVLGSQRGCKKDFVFLVLVKTGINENCAPSVGQKRPDGGIGDLEPDVFLCLHVVGRSTWLQKMVVYSWFL